MRAVLRITSVRFFRYKALSDFSLAIDRFNILVGPNNAGKSTILGAFRILAEAMRKANAKSPTYVQGPDGLTLGYEISLEHIPVATENVFHNYDEETPPKVTFRMSNGHHLLLYFPRPGVCYLICENAGRPIKSPSAFRQAFGFEIGFVPILGPVEHNELLYQADAARDALLTHRASRNFRNIWYHRPERFEEFRDLVKSTWPGMDIQQPEVDTTHEKPLLRMFCPEDRIDREIFWAGFGFQVWCQMLTFMVANKEASLFIIDEPDIYLHSDLQRQLVSILRTLGPDILIATHSPEIILEADPGEILLVAKAARSAKRIANPAQLQSVFNVLGSNLNLFLTQLARSKRLLFVEGKDFQIISWFAAKIKCGIVASRSNFAVVPTRGFNTLKAKMLTEGAAIAVGAKLNVAIVFDRDYRSDLEVQTELLEMGAFCQYGHIHSKNELENFLLVPEALERAIVERVAERSKRTGKDLVFTDGIRALLLRISEELKYDIQAQFLERQKPFAKTQDRSVDDTVITRRLLEAFEGRWRDLDSRLDLVPGKDILTNLNSHLQDRWGITVTASAIIGSMKEGEVPSEMRTMIDAIHNFAMGALSVEP